MQFRRIFWGVVFILAAVYFVVSYVYDFSLHISPWKIIGSIGLLYAFVESVGSRSIWGISVSLVGLYWLIGDYFFPQVIPVSILFTAAVLLAVGIQMLLGSRKGRNSNCEKTKKSGGVFPSIETNDFYEDVVYRRSSCGKSDIFLHSKNLTRAEFECFASDMQVYFNDAQLNPNGAAVTIHCTMGSLKLYIPKAWQVNADIEVMIGGAQEKNKYNNISGPQVTVTGMVKMGQVEIIYI